MRKIFAPLGVLLSLAAAGSAHATVSYTFDSDNQGWTTGDVSTVAPDTGRHAAGWTTGRLSAGDEAGETGFYAPTAVLGNQSAAYGQAISFDVSDAFNDSVAYPALILWGTNGLAAAVLAGPPSTDNNALTSYSFLLNESVFSAFAGGNGVGGALTQAQFQSILGDLAGIGFRSEYKTGDDDSRFDNAVFNGFVDANAPPVESGVPEPSTWALSIVGFGMMGAGMRRRRRVAFKFA